MRRAPRFLGMFSIMHPRPGFRLLRASCLGLALAYVIAWGYVTSRGVRIVFDPPPASYAAEDCRFIAGRDGRRIACVYFSRPAARHTLIYSHGSATDLGRVAPILSAHRDLGLNVLAYDYPGIGLSEGPLSEEGCHAALEDVFAWLLARGVPRESILLYGRSIGTGPTLRLAARERVAGVILASPFTSAFGHRPWMRLFPGDWFNNLEHIGAVSSPLLILHGLEDSTLSPDNARSLHALSRPGAVLELIPGRGHADLHLSTEYWTRLRAWLALPPPASGSVAN
jgi:abhydrolase domain-containing protein 17